MITDNELYSLAVFLGALAMLLIVLYHFLEVNSDDAHAAEGAEKPLTAASTASAPPTPAVRTPGTAGGKKGGR